MPFKEKNNREAVVVCAIHVVKRPSKRSVLVYIYVTEDVGSGNFNDFSSPLIRFQLTTALIRFPNL